MQESAKGGIFGIEGRKRGWGGERRVKTNIGTFPPADSGSFCKAVGGGKGVREGPSPHT